MLRAYSDALQEDKGLGIETAGVILTVHFLRLIVWCDKGAFRWTREVSSDYAKTVGCIGCLGPQKKKKPPLLPPKVQLLHLRAMGGCDPHRRYLLGLWCRRRLVSRGLHDATLLRRQL
jgi:hypothetical protein